MWTLIILVLLAAGGFYFYTKQKEKKKDREVLKPAPWEDEPPPADAPELTPVPDKPVKKVPVKKTPIKKVPVKKSPPANKPEKPAPAGWFYNGAGHLLRNPDPTGLWNFDVARQTKQIDFADVGGVMPAIQVIGNINLHQLAYNAFRLPDESFFVDMAQTALFNTAVLYLCDKTGKVIDYTISAEGRRLAEKNIVYTKGDLKGGPYIVQASNGLSAGSTFGRPRR